jgi:hypothetical protein
MSFKSNIASFPQLQCLLCVFMIATVSPVNSQEAVRIPINIFGDGNPLNGVEDNREQIAAQHYEAADHTAENMYAGTIKCDRKIRGTAMVIDVRKMSPDLKGVVLISAAHVLYDLEKGRLFRRCKFDFMGWENVAGYRSKINLKKIRSGGFDPGRETQEVAFGQGDWVFLYLPKPWKKFNPDQSVQLKEFSFAHSESFQQLGGEFRLMAFDSKARAISQSRNCTVIESRRDDLGGGHWAGQLLDDCDSADGASGGGIIALLNHQQFLIGVRSGSHWSEEIFPEDRFPTGPPEGSIWNRRSNTNFGRAIDNGLLNELFLFFKTIEN